MSLVKSMPGLQFRLNLTDHLAETRTIFQTGTWYEMGWNQICELFLSYFKNNFSDIKDTKGFSFGDFKQYTQKEWRMKLYTEYLNLDEKLGSMQQNDKKYQKTHFKWEKLNTENKRLDVLQELCPNGPEASFHRLAADCINKSAIIIDYDNSPTVESINSKTGKLEKYEHKMFPIKSIDVYKTLLTLNCNFLIYSSFSSETHREKFRVILPLDVPVLSKDLQAINETIINLLIQPTDLIYGLVDPTSFEMPRMFYMPVNKPSKKSEPESFINFRSIDQYLSVELLHEYRNKRKKQMVSGRNWWITTEYISKKRKTLSF